jgi:hypothetical protein
VVEAGTSAQRARQQQPSSAEAPSNSRAARPHHTPHPRPPRCGARCRSQTSGSSATASSTVRRALSRSSRSGRRRSSQRWSERAPQRAPEPAPMCASARAAAPSRALCTAGLRRALPWLLRAPPWLLCVKVCPPDSARPACVPGVCTPCLCLHSQCEAACPLAPGREVPGASHAAPPLPLLLALGLEWPCVPLSAACYVPSVRPAVLGVQPGVMGEPNAGGAGPGRWALGAGCSRRGPAERAEPRAGRLLPFLNQPATSSALQNSPGWDEQCFYRSGSHQLYNRLGQASAWGLGEADAALCCGARKGCGIGGAGRPAYGDGRAGRRPSLSLNATWGG